MAWLVSSIAQVHPKQEQQLKGMALAWKKKGRLVGEPVEVSLGDTLPTDSEQGPGKESKLLSPLVSHVLGDCLAEKK